MSQNIQQETLQIFQYDQFRELSQLGNRLTQCFYWEGQGGSEPEMDEVTKNDILSNDCLKIFQYLLNDIVARLIKMKEECAVYMLKSVMYLPGNLGELWEEFIDVLQNMASMFSPSEFLKMTKTMLIDFNRSDYELFDINANKAILVVKFPLFINWLADVIKQLDYEHLDENFLRVQENFIIGFAWNEEIENIFKDCFLNNECVDIPCNRVLLNTISEKLNNLIQANNQNLLVSNNQEPFDQQSQSNYDDDSIQNENNMSNPDQNNEFLRYETQAKHTNPNVPNQKGVKGSPSKLNQRQVKDEFVNILCMLSSDKNPSKHIEYFLDIIDNKILEVEFKEISSYCEKLLTQMNDSENDTNQDMSEEQQVLECNNGNRKLNVYEIGIIFEKIGDRMTITEKDKLLVLLLSTAGKFSSFSPNLIYPLQDSCTNFLRCFKFASSLVMKNYEQYDYQRYLVNIFPIVVSKVDFDSLAKEQLGFQCETLIEGLGMEIQSNFCTNILNKCLSHFGKTELIHLFEKELVHSTKLWNIFMQFIDLKFARK